MTYYVYGVLSCIGGGYLHIKNGKRIWGRMQDMDFFSKSEIEDILKSIGSEWTWMCYSRDRRLYKSHIAQEVFI